MNYHRSPFINRNHGSRWFRKLFYTSRPFQTSCIHPTIHSWSFSSVGMDVVIQYRGVIHYNDINYHINNRMKGLQKIGRLSCQKLMAFYRTKNNRQYFLDRSTVKFRLSCNWQERTDPIAGQYSQ